MFFCDFIVGSFLKSKGKTNLTPNSPCVLHYKHMSLLLSKTYTNSVKNNIVFPWAPKFFFRMRNYVRTTCARAPKCFCGQNYGQITCARAPKCFCRQNYVQTTCARAPKCFRRQNYVRTTCTRAPKCFL